jgi:hypothetical protein
LIERSHTHRKQIDSRQFLRFDFRRLLERRPPHLDQSALGDTEFAGSSPDWEMGNPR